MRATDGAIEACTIDKETMEPTYKVVGDPEPNRSVFVAPESLM